MTGELGNGGFANVAWVDSPVGWMCWESLVVSVPQGTLTIPRMSLLESSSYQEEWPLRKKQGWGLGIECQSQVEHIELFCGPQKHGQHEICQTNLAIFCRVGL